MTQNDQAARQKALWPLDKLHLAVVDYLPEELLEPIAAYVAEIRAALQVAPPVTEGKPRCQRCNDKLGHEDDGLTICRFCDMTPTPQPLADVSEDERLAGSILKEMHKLRCGDETTAALIYSKSDERSAAAPVTVDKSRDALIGFEAVMKNYRQIVNLYLSHDREETIRALLTAAAHKERAILPKYKCDFCKDTGIFTYIDQAWGQGLDRTVHEPCTCTTVAKGTSNDKS